MAEMEEKFQVSEATKEDEKKLVALINCAYGGLTQDGITTAEDSHGGWTDEKHLFHGDRARITPEQLPLIHPEDPNRVFFKVVELRTGKVVACVQVRKRSADTVYVGLLSVLPAYQSKGLGSKLLKVAEDWAKAQKASRITMTTVEGRDSLIQYYLRRGYKDTGVRTPFTPHSTDQMTKPLTFLSLEKQLP